MKLFLNRIYLILALLTVTGCMTIYHDGKPTLRIASNFTGKIHVAADGSTDIDGTVNNSAVIQSYGTAGAKVGATASTAFLIH